MNSSELQLVETTLKGLLTPNNEDRRKAESQLSQMMSNPIGLVLCFSHLLQHSDVGVASYAAVLIKKLIKPKDSEDVAKVWLDASPEMKDNIKLNCITALFNCKNKSLSRKIATAVNYLIDNIYGEKAKWDDAIKFIVNGFSLPLTPENAITVGNAVFLLSKSFNVIEDDIIGGIDVLVEGFNRFFKEGSIDIKAGSCEAICEILCGYLNKKSKKKFREFIFQMLQTLLECLNANDSDNLKCVLFAVSDLAQNEPTYLKKHFADIFVLMGKIYEKRDLDGDAVRTISFEIILTLVENIKNLLDKDKTNTLMTSIFKYAMEIDEVIDDDWLTPKSTSLVNESYITEEKLDEAMSLIDRLILAVGADEALPIVASTITELLGHAGESWKYQYIAFIAVSKICEHVDDITKIESLLNVIFAQLDNANPKIRYSVLMCIDSFCDNFEEAFTEVHTVVPKILELHKNEKVLRVQTQIFDTIQTFIEKASTSTVQSFVQSFLDVIFTTFMKNDNECPALLREAVLDTLGELLSKVNDNFKPFAVKSFEILFQYLSQILKAENGNNDLFGNLIDILTRVGEFCPEMLEKNALDIAKTLILFQNNIANFKGNVGEYFEASWEKIIPFIKKSHTDIIPAILESALKVITKPPEISVSSNPEQTFDVQKFLCDVDISEKKVELQKEKFTLNTTETEEYSIFLEIFNLFLTELKEYVLPYAEIVEREAKRVLSYPNNDIRVEACKIFPALIKVIALTSQKEKLSMCIKSYLTVLIEAAKTDKESLVVSSILDAVNDLIKDQEKLLTEMEIQQLFTELFMIFDKTEIARLNLLKEEKIAQKEVDESTNRPKTGDDDDDDDNDEKINNLENIRDEIHEIEEVVTSFADVVGSIFKSHKELSLGIAKKTLENILPKYFEASASNFEKKMGLFILDDLVEFLGQELLNDIWPNIIHIYVPYIVSPFPELRQAASYGLGEFIVHTKNGFENYAKDVYDALQKGLVVANQGSPEDEFYTAQDNVITAFGKLIKYHGTHFPNLKEMIAQWLQYLPITHDIGECPGMHGLLCDIIINSASVIFGENNANVPKIIRVLCKIHGTQYSNEEIDKKVMQILMEFKNNATFAGSIAAAKEGAKKGILAKINKLLG